MQASVEQKKNFLPIKKVVTLVSFAIIVKYTVFILTFVAFKILKEKERNVSKGRPK